MDKIDEVLREKALEKALKFIAASHDDYTSEAVIDVAEIFYDFLKGETK